MPEAPIEEDGKSMAVEDYVRCTGGARYKSLMNSIPKADAVQGGTNSQLARVVFRTRCRHSLAGIDCGFLHLRPPFSAKGYTACITARWCFTSSRNPSSNAKALESALVKKPFVARAESNCVLCLKKALSEVATSERGQLETRET
jgi:hypothetical protein